jgi:hypothetical protein
LGVKCILEDGEISSWDFILKLGVNNCMIKYTSLKISSMRDLGKIESTSAILLTSNMIAIIIAVFLNYELQAIAWIYFIEMIQIGFFGFLTLVARGFQSKIQMRRMMYLTGSMVYLFSLAFIVYFLYLLFPFIKLVLPLDFNIMHVGQTAGLLFVSHSLSFIINVVLKKSKDDIGPASKEMGKELEKYRHKIEKDMQMLMVAPFTRASSIMYSIVLVMVAIALAPSGMVKTAAVVAFMLMKTFWDLRAHQYKHQLIEVYKKKGL